MESPTTGGTPGGPNDPAADPVPGLAAAAAHHRRGTAAASAGHPQKAAEHFRAGLRLLGPFPEDPLAAAQAARLLISLASAEAEQGRVDAGLRLLDQAGHLTGPLDRGMLFSQRALLQWRAGRYRAALPLFERAVELLATHPDPRALATVLLNRAGLHMSEMRLSAARADLARSGGIAREIGADLIGFKALNGIGYCELLVGNIPAALEILGRVEAGYRAHGPGNVPIAQVDRARALMAAGLAHEAVGDLASAIAAFQEQRLTADRSDAELTLARALAASGDPAGAMTQARRAERHFRAREDRTGATLARLAAATAEFEHWFVATDDREAKGSAPVPFPVPVPADRPPPARRAGADSPDSSPDGGPRTAARLARQAQRLAADLEGLGLVRDAALARLLAARALLRAGRPAGQVGALVRAAVPRGVGLPLETRLVAHLARAEVAAALGARSTAYAALRAGLDLLDTHRRRLGSLDLQTGVAALGRELTRTGLGLAVDSGSPPVVFAWSERSRAQASRVRPVRSVHAPDTAESIARLRHLDHRLRSDENEGLDAEARREHASLRRKLLEDSWTTAGPGLPHDARQVSMAQVAARLDERGHRMISFVRRGGTLLALVVADGRARLVGLGDYPRAVEAARRLAGDLDARTARRLPERLATVIDASIRTQTYVLTAELLSPLIRDRTLPPDDGTPVVLVPTGALASVPWPLLPALSGRPLTVAPSARMWLAADRPRDDPGDGGPDRRPLLVAGPHLANADQEVAALSGCYPDAVTLTGARATVDSVLAAMDGTHTVHLAVHGHHERGNVLFSRIDLADGPLMAYDLQRLARPPRRVILSACEVGTADIRSGDEQLGFTAALLHTGTATVVSSSARVPDDTAPGLMTAMHEALAREIAPAAALARAAAGFPYSTFVCYGSGSV